MPFQYPAIINPGQITDTEISASAAIADSKINPVPSTELSSHTTATAPHSAHLKASTGTYTGGGGTNRAIAHGLGRVPYQVQITSSSADIGNIVIQQGATTAHSTHSGADYRASVTAMDATNFYVTVTGGGDDNGYAYRWVAVG